ncbi:hypothetical protein [Breoghania sp.]|uniref:hypothetical protein n=1 Tax=Breoghania sp. TaxID=2065378 RepID=UPI002601D2F4|nr:hypothetical protein [Breoghania sp.]MDJ0932115.1 hypothetical protein [Breoghania sp.]
MLDVYASELCFDGRSTISAEAQWDEDPALSSAGTLTLVMPGGSAIDMIATNGVTFGTLGALVDLRDDYLVEDSGPARRVCQPDVAGIVQLHGGKHGRGRDLAPAGT